MLERMAYKGHSPDSDSLYHRLVAYYVLCWASKPSNICKNGFAHCDFIGIVMCAVSAGCPRPWSGHEESGTGPSAAQTLQASNPNTSSALSCKYHQQLVAHKLVVLNKLLAYMWRSKELHSPPCWPSCRRTVTCIKWITELSKIIFYSFLFSAQVLWGVAGKKEILSVNGRSTFLETQTCLIDRQFC